MDPYSGQQGSSSQLHQQHEMYHSAVNPQEQYGPMSEQEQGYYPSHYGHEQYDAMNQKHNPHNDDQHDYDGINEHNQEHYDQQMHYQQGQHSGQYSMNMAHPNSTLYQQPSHSLHSEPSYSQQYDPVAVYHSDSHPHLSQRHSPPPQQYDSAYQIGWDGSPRRNPDAAAPHLILQRDVEEDGAFIDDMAPIDEALASHASRSSCAYPSTQFPLRSPKSQVDPPEDEPPSLSIYKQPHPSGKHANSVLAGGSYSVYSVEGSQQPSSIYHDDECYSSPEKSYRGPDEYPDKEYQHEDQHFIHEGYQYDDAQAEVDRPVDDQHYYERPQRVLSQVKSQISYVSTEDNGQEQVMSPVSDNEFVASPASGSHYSIPVSDGDYGSLEMSPPHRENDSNAYSSPTARDTGLPPHSPRSDYSQSTALRGAQELLRRNRARRLSAAQKKEDESSCRDGGACQDPTTTPLSANTQTELDSGGTWESSSEMTSIVSGSSQWTDNENNPDRSSRRALILQMAKARMKSNKSTSSTTPTSVQSPGDVSNMGTSHSHHLQQQQQQQHHRSKFQFDEEEEEKKLDHRETGSDINLVEDLD